ncbi:hypothetical protein ACQFZT_000371 [Providencia stuartii]|uniref:hypothetical protein n=1 Tax=Providencia stuartii TaxID=588 RepID=UPI0028BF9F53|nr:hypothetical protein [Providencia stuartii]MDT7050250.1 hypothetical protein [Providencia stuartii]
MIKKSIIAIVLSCIGFSVYAGTSYTKEELNKLVDSGNPPKEKYEQILGTDTMPFSPCKSDVNKMYNQLIGEYPVKVIQNSPDSYVVKMWANDGFVVAKCANGQKIVSGAEYE